MYFVQFLLAVGEAQRRRVPGGARGVDVEVRRRAAARSRVGGRELHGDRHGVGAARTGRAGSSDPVVTGAR